MSGAGTMGPTGSRAAPEREAKAQRGDDPAAWIHPLVGDHWPFLRGRIVAATDDARGIPLDGAGHDAALADALARFDRAQGATDARGLASLWIQWYAVTAWPPLVAAILAFGRAPALAGPGVALRVDEHGRPTGLRVPPGMHAVGPAAALETLARVQAAPLVDHLSTHAGMAPRVAWSNLGNVLGWALDELARVLPAEALAPAYAFMARRRCSDGRANPLYSDAPCVPATGRPPRRVCCVRYRLAGFGYCGDCPIPPHRRDPGVVSDS